MSYTRLLPLVVCLLTVPSLMARAEEPATTDKARQKARLLQQMDSLRQELDALDTPPPAATASQPTNAPTPQPPESTPATLPGLLVTDSKPRVTEQPAGQTITAVGREQFKDSPAFSIGDVLKLAPGVTISQGNGPRDVSISVRGSNARQTFGIRNVQVFEDGFPVTQPDGLARTDLIDPHAYSGIDVIQGPSSALYGNYATGGAIHFRSRPGREINGIEFGLDGGSFGYYNAYATLGNRGDTYEYTLFGSFVASDGHTSHTGFRTTTESLLASYRPTPRDTLTLKVVNNDLNADLSIRLSLDQFKLNPYQKGCGVVLPGTGCAAVSLFANGFNGPRVSLSADQADLGRNDRRTIVGARWEHNFTPTTAWRTQVVFDNRDITQPTGATSAIGTFPSVNFLSDVTHNGALFGRKASHFVGIFVNYENNKASTYNVTPNGIGAPSGKARIGGLTQTVFGNHLNLGARGREEITFHPQWKGIVGLGGEYTKLDAVQTNYTYPTSATPTLAQIDGERHFFNLAPEVAVVYQPHTAWQLQARIATGYGTPQLGNLFVTPQGVPGNNTQLTSQRNLGYDLGVDWTLGRTVRASLMGFYEFFTNELVTQSPGANLLNFTFNAPRSEHRGIALTADIHPLVDLVPGAYVSVAYLFNDQRYTRYTERLSAGSRSTTFDRSGNRLPGVPPHYLHTRVGYDQPHGPWRGLGGFVDVDYQAGFPIDNANLVKVPAYTLVNLNLHYERALPFTYVTGLRLFVEARNLLDTTYVASAANVSDSLNATTGEQNPASVVSAATGSIRAGEPRAFFGGVRLQF